jgi:hypothetical protein
VVGGALTQLAGWRWIFLVSVFGPLAESVKGARHAAGGRLDPVLAA